jgi:hypothetical protein
MAGDYDKVHFNSIISYQNEVAGVVIESLRCIADCTNIVAGKLQHQHDTFMPLLLQQKFMILDQKLLDKSKFLRV